MKFSFSFQLSLFLCIFLGVAAYMVGGLETEDGRVLLYLVLFGGLASTIRAVYMKNKILRQQQKLLDTEKEHE